MLQIFTICASFYPFNSFIFSSCSLDNLSLSSCVISLSLVISYARGEYCIVEYAVGLEEDALCNDGSEKIEGNWVGHITPGTWNKPIDKGGLKSAREIVGGITKTDDIVGGITEAKVGVARKAKSSSIVGGITAVESKTEVVGGITAAKSKTEIVGGITAVKSTGDNEIVGGITAVKI